MYYSDFDRINVLKKLGQLRKTSNLVFVKWQKRKQTLHFSRVRSCYRKGRFTTWIVKFKQIMDFKFNPHMKSNLINSVQCQKGKQLLNFGVSSLENDVRNFRSCALTYISRVVRIGLTATRVFGHGSNKNMHRRWLKNDNIHNLLFLQTRNLTPDIIRYAVNKA
jgi:hypothetical protein